jgi:hypothetical protein
MVHLFVIHCLLSILTKRSEVVCMYVCMHACIYVCVCIMYVCVYLRTYVCVYVCMCVRMYDCVCMYVYMHVCMNVCIYVRTYVWMYVRMCDVRTYVCVCVYVLCMNVYASMYVLGLLPSSLFLSVKLSNAVEDNAVAYLTYVSSHGICLLQAMKSSPTTCSGSVIIHDVAHTAHCGRSLSTLVFHSGAQT